MTRIVVCLLAAYMMVQPIIAFADTSVQRKIDALFVALGLPELLEIMRIEGAAHGDMIAAQVLADRGNPEWDGVVARIYDPDFMTQELRAGFDEELRDSDLDAMLAFFTTQPGKSIVSLEISARRAMLDEAIDAASKDAAAQARGKQTPRYRLISDFIAANDLVARNVAGAMNANYAFYLGLMDGGALPSSMTPDMALRQVWATEADVRASTEEWLEAFLLLALQPVSDEDLARYIAFSQSAAGRDLTAALAVAFEGLFADVSRSLGRAAARFLISREL